MCQTKSATDRWTNCQIGITGASGSLGRALTKELRSKGASIIGFSHRSIKNASQESSQAEPNKWIQWQCGEEALLDEELAKLDILILNHGINPQGKQNPSDINVALEVNALSSWRLMERFENLVLKEKNLIRPREVWINTSEAEIQPALSPVYELSKRLIGEIVSLRWSNLTKKQREVFTIRKLVLGPFRSDLNPFGIMTANWVAKQVIRQIELKFPLVIVSPNPITYILMPLTEVLRANYSRIMRNAFGNK